jgi:copper chaperone NosL
MNPLRRPSRLTRNAPWIAVSAILFALLLVACPAVLRLNLLGDCGACAPQGEEPRPPDIAYGQDLCDACGMLIGDPKFAAATVTTRGQTRKFDDIGDMIVYHMDHPDEQVRAWFVHDYLSEAWMRAETAYFVASPQIDSPMGHGLAAFATRADAEAFARDRGVSVLTFNEVRITVHLAAH